ncbi:MAG: thioredoxin-dependent thiol peroxidase [Cellvibrionales bacterium]|nr:thioredoxin-dependent thiol peroxidase [Cellvibrionales bacterium]
MALIAGNKAPAFSLKNQAGDTVALNDFLNKKYVLLYFYPKASTPGCTVQAQGIRDHLQAFADLDIEVIAISPDPVDKIGKFVDKHALNFHLLSDEDHKIADEYGVWGMKKFMGKEFMGLIRSTFLIGKDGKLLEQLPKFTTKNHHEVALDAFKKYL